MLTTFITAIAWIYAVFYFAVNARLMLAYALHPEARLKIKAIPVLLWLSALAWIMATFIS